MIGPLNKSQKNQLSWAITYLLSIILWTAVFTKFDEYRYINTIALFIIALIQTLYGIHQAHINSNKKILQRYSVSLLGILLFILAIINWAALFNRPLIIFGTLLFVILSFWFIVISENFKQLLNPNSLLHFFLNYLFIVVQINLFFALIYSLVDFIDIGSIVNDKGDIIKNNIDLTLFSLSIFYSSITKYTPIGIAKMVSIINVMISYFIHVIIIGYVIQEKIPKWKKSLAGN